MTYEEYKEANHYDRLNDYQQHRYDSMWRGMQKGDTNFDSVYQYILATRKTITGNPTTRQLFAEENLKSIEKALAKDME